MNFAKKTTRKLIVIFLILCFIAIRVSAGHVFIVSSIERVEISSGTCLFIDSNCSINKNNQIDLGDNPTSKLNLTYHLLGNLINTETLLNDNAPHLVSPAFDKTPLQSLFQADIFHPPKI
jgi:type 1 fimbria pilin